MTRRRSGETAALFGCEWFDRHQLPLLVLANCRMGRRLLRVENDVPRDRWVIGLTPNAITWSNESLSETSRKLMRGEPLLLTTDFRTHPKFSKRLAHDFFPYPIKGWTSLIRIWRNHVRIAPAWADLAFIGYPDPDPETTSVDGYVQHSYSLGSGVAWATFIAAAGTSANDSTTNNQIVRIFSDNVSDQWIDGIRAIYVFDTGLVPTDALISSGTFSVYGSSKADNLAIAPDLNVYASAPVSNTALAAGDFDSLGSTAFATAISYAGFSTTGYNDFALNASGIAAVTKAGISKFGLRNANYDVAAVAPTWSSFVSSGFGGFYADQAGTGNDPKLVVRYTTARFFNAFLGLRLTA